MLKSGDIMIYQGTMCLRFESNRTWFYVQGHDLIMCNQPNANILEEAYQEYLKGE